MLSTMHEHEVGEGRGRNLGWWIRPLTKGNNEDGFHAFATCGLATFHLSRICCCTCLPGCGTAQQGKTLVMWLINAKKFPLRWV